MPAMAIEFGYYPHALEIQSGPVSLATLPDLEQKVGAVETDVCVEGDWIYAPPRRVRHFPSGDTRDRPYPSRIFSLPKTHRLTHASADSDDHLAFIIWVLSFFTGMRLTATEAGFIDSTPIQRGKLVDFILIGHRLDRVLDLAEAFWAMHRAGSKQPQHLSAAIHTLFLAKNPQNLEFERFNYLFAALDACYASAEALQSPPPRLGHAGRILWICELFGMPVPGWAVKDADRKTEVSNIRNDAVHEALFMGAPYGFAVHETASGLHLALEMEALVCRFLVALLGSKDSDYVRSPINTRQRCGLMLR